MIEENKYDDIYLVYIDDKVWPENERKKSMHVDTSEELNVEIKNISADQEVVIELWDWDLLSRDDLLGNFSFVVEGIGGPYSTDLEQNIKETKKAKYTLEWEVF